MWIKGGRTISNLYITDHAEGRFRERVGLPKRLATRKAQEALERGITHAEASGQLRRYFDALYLSHESANNIRVYCGTVYIFSYDTLITVFPLPQNLRKIAVKIQQKKKDG